MAHAIVIIGGLGDDVDRDALLGELREKSGPGIEWDWIKASGDEYIVPAKPLNRLLARLTDNSDPAEKPRVVKLFRLHARIVSLLHRACRDPVLAPKPIDHKEELIAWLFSAEANLFPRREWYGNLQEATLVTILTKLIKNKSWNKDNQGHQWTKEEDLLGQAPVYRPEFPGVAREAAKMLPRLKGTLLLCKGGKQGKTPREWSICLSALPSVKQSMIEFSLTPLLTVPGLVAFVKRASKDKQTTFRLDDTVVTERVRDTCRTPRA